MKNTVVLGVTSGIAAFKSIDLVKKLTGEGIDVFVIMTKSAVKMVSAGDFEKASGHKVSTDLFEEGFDYRDVLKARKVDHIDTADKADVLVIAPATANIIAKLAHGIADDFLTTTALAVTAPVVICPSMNVNMWNNPVVQGNIEKLRNLGYLIIEPATGLLACGYRGAGRLAEIEDIKKFVVEQLHISTSLRGKKIIVTSGGTIEKIDDVRYIANRSSGKMGIAIAEACFLRGADVLLLRAKNSQKPRYLIKEEEFSTVEELYGLIKKYIKDYHYIYHAAAVSDFKVQKSQEGKISSGKPLSIQLEPQMKILEQIKKINPGICLIGFKAEYTSDEKVIVEKALKKLNESNADVVIANDVSKNDKGFDSDNNEVFIVLSDGEYKHVAKDLKKNIAKEIVDYINSKL